MKPTTAQQRAIDSNSPAILCLASPGSGKSSTLAARIKRLIDDGVNPREIVAITFTTAGANALDEKLIGQVEHGPDCETTEFLKLGFSGTLHSFALRMLKQYGASIGYGARIALIDAEASADLLQSKATSLGCKLALDKLLALKAQGRPSGRMDVAQTVVAGYYDELREGGLVDFDTLLTEFARLLSFDTSRILNYSKESIITFGIPVTNGGVEGRFLYLFVDECQDSSEIDWRIYDALPIANKFFVGDSDQAIYAFRGGRVDCLMRYAKRPGVEVITLAENFRSHTEICDAANRLIAHNVDRIDKAMISAKGPGGVVYVQGASMNEGAEIALVTEIIKYDSNPSEIAILARTNAICAAYREALKASGIPVAEAPKSTLPRDWSLAKSLVELLVDPDNDTLAFFYRLAWTIANGADAKSARAEVHTDKMKASIAGKTLNQWTVNFDRNWTISSLPAAFIGQEISTESRMRVAELIRSLPFDATLVDLALAMNVQEPEPVAKTSGVTVTTMHQSKGREFDVVFIVGAEDEIIPGVRKGDTAADLEESRRLFFVAATRARKALYVAHAQQRKTSWGTIASHTPSRFISELLS